LKESYNILIPNSLKEPNSWKLTRLLRARSDRPSGPAAEQRDELAPS
jgi:hypothetical protein